MLFNSGWQTSMLWPCTRVCWYTNILHLSFDAFWWCHLINLAPQNTSTMLFSSQWVVTMQVRVCRSTTVITLIVWLQVSLSLFPLQVGSREESDSTFSSDDIYPVHSHFLSYLSQGYTEPPQPRLVPVVKTQTHSVISLLLHGSSLDVVHVHVCALLFKNRSVVSLCANVVWLTIYI